VARFPDLASFSSQIRVIIPQKTGGAWAPSANCDFHAMWLIRKGQSHLRLDFWLVSEENPDMLFAEVLNL